MWDHRAIKRSCYLFLDKITIYTAQYNLFDAVAQRRLLKCVRHNWTQLGTRKNIKNLDSPEAETKRAGYSLLFPLFANHYLGLKQKRFFPFSRKAKMMRKLSNFREISFRAKGYISAINIFKMINSNGNLTILVHVH
jgi:hypothetical protein